MRNLKTRPLLPWLFGAALLCACKSASTSSAASDSAREAEQIIARWAAAFRESNVDAIASLYAPDASFFGTGSRALVTTPEQIRRYFETGLNRDKPRGAELLEHSVQVVSDDVVIVTGMDRVSGMKNGSVYHADGRVTFILRKQASAWQIIHFHRSALPAG